MTVMAAARPMVWMVCTGMRSIPRKHRTSVPPETATVCPEVDSMISTARAAPWPACTWLRLALGVGFGLGLGLGFGLG